MALFDVAGLSVILRQDQFADAEEGGGSLVVDPDAAVGQLFADDAIVFVLAGLGAAGVLVA